MSFKRRTMKSVVAFAFGISIFIYCCCHYLILNHPVLYVHDNFDGINNNLTPVDSDINPNFIPNNLLKNHSNVLLQTLYAFAKLCDDNNISYFIWFGAAIGALRHHSLVPWDDDIDIIINPQNVSALHLSIQKYPNKYDLCSMDDANFFRFSFQNDYIEISKDRMCPKWPFIDIYIGFEPCRFKGMFYQTFEYGRFRYVFLVDANDPYNLNGKLTEYQANNLIFTIPHNGHLIYKKLGYLDTLKCTSFDHVKGEEHNICDENTWNITDSFRKHFNFVQKRYINNTYEIQRLYLLNTNKIIQEVIYIRNVVETKGINQRKFYCNEYAKRIKYNLDQSINITQEKNIGYFVMCKQQCLYDITEMSIHPYLHCKTNIPRLDPMRAHCP